MRISVSHVIFPFVMQTSHIIHSINYGTDIAHIAFVTKLKLNHQTS